MSGFNAFDRGTLLSIVVLLEACAGPSTPPRIKKAAERLVQPFDVDDESHPPAAGVHFR